MDNQTNNKPYIVFDYELLERIVADGHLGNIAGVSWNRNDPTRRVWFVDRIPEIAQIIRKYKEGNSCE